MRSARRENTLGGLEESICMAALRVGSRRSYTSWRDFLGPDWRRYKRVTGVDMCRFVFRV